MKFDVKENTFFRIKELTGLYKANHRKKTVTAYDSPSSNKGVVRGLYESLVAGRWTIEK